METLCLAKTIEHFMCSNKNLSKSFVVFFQRLKILTLVIHSSNQLNDQRSSRIFHLHPACFLELQTVLGLLFAE